MPDDDKPTYDMICAADTVGVFQIESRAQMSMLPRLQPRCFYDLVIEVAIVRPGPIQGGMVHPYLRNRDAARRADRPPRDLKPALERTLGVPIFQEQVMQIAMLAADFTAGEADALRRAMAAWKRKGGLGPFHERLVGRMVEKGYDARVRRAHLQADRGLRRIRLSRKPCGELRAAGLCQLLAQAPRTGRLPGRPAEQPADGLLCALAAVAGCARARRRRCGRWTCVPASETARMTMRRQLTGANPLRAGTAGTSNRVGVGNGPPSASLAARAEAPFAAPETWPVALALDAARPPRAGAANALQTRSTGHRHQAAWAVPASTLAPRRCCSSTRTHEAAVDARRP